MLKHEFYGRAKLVPAAQAHPDQILTNGSTEHRNLRRYQDSLAFERIRCERLALLLKSVGQRSTKPESARSTGRVS
jgi:hypothetical protein